MGCSACAFDCAQAVPAISVQMRVMQGQISSVLGVNNANLQQVRTSSTEEL